MREGEERRSSLPLLYLTQRSTLGLSQHAFASVTLHNGRAADRGGFEQSARVTCIENTFKSLAVFHCLNGQ